VNDATERLLERLQTGWLPVAEQIDRDVPQRAIHDWHWMTVMPRSVIIIGHDDDGRLAYTDFVLWIDAAFAWALCEDGFVWLAPADREIAVERALAILDKTPDVPAEPGDEMPPTKTLAPCIVCGCQLDDCSAGNNQPDGRLAFECRGHWPSSVFDRGDGTWLEINICESCLRTATERGRVLHGDREHRRARATYKLWQWPKR